MRAHGIKPIDLLVVNLYPFEATIARGACFEDCIENIDIGGPAMIRAAAKNHDDVAVVVDAADYAAVLEALNRMAARRHGGCAAACAAKAYARTAAYDAAISNWFAEALSEQAPTFRAVGGKLAEASALRREPASGGRVLSHAGAAARRRHRPAGAGQDAFLQQSQRHRRGL